jgi:glycosyltransferase involved in cell wall biosynthesis
MKSILLISQYFYPERFRINDLASQLVKNGYNVTVLTGIPNYPHGKYFSGYSFFNRNKDNLHNGVNIIRLPVFARGKSKISLAINYLSFIILGYFFAVFTKRNFDIVITYGISPILQAIPGIIYSKRKKISSYLYLMDFWPFSIEAVDGIKSKILIKLISRISKWIYLNSDHILISSEAYKSNLINYGISDKKITYWPQHHEDFYFPRKPNFLLTPEIDEGKFNIIFTGNFGRGQGIGDLLNFVKEYNQKLINLSINFIFIGDGIENNILTKFVKDSQIDNLVKFIGSKDAELIPQYLANAQVALLILNKHPHLSQVLPAKLSSYVGCKIPIFSISTDPISSFIVKNNFGISTYSYDYVEYFNKLIELIENYSTIRANVLNSYDYFSSTVLIKQLIKIIS